MKRTWQNIKQHPVSVFFYIVYTLLWYNTYQSGKHHITDGGLLGLAGVFTAIVFIIICLINAFNTKSYRFYFWLIFFIIIPIPIVSYFSQY